MIELRRLRYLVVLAKRLSFSHAAGDLGISQSALTRAIQSLEQEIGIRLFDRDRSGVSLTEQGRWVVEKAEALLVNATDFAHQMDFAARGAEGRSRFGMTELAAYTLVPAILPSRLQSAPGFAHEVLVRNVEPLWLMLTEGQIEFLVCSEWNSDWPIPEALPVRIEAIGKLPISLVVRRGHPLLNGPLEASGYPLLVGNPTSVSGQLTARLRERLATSVQVIEDFGALSAVVRNSDAVWLTSPFSVTFEIAQGALCEIPLPKDLQPNSFELSMYSLARRSQSPAALELKQAFKNHINNLLTTGYGKSRPTA